MIRQCRLFRRNGQIWRLENNVPMARLSDFPRVIKAIGWYRFLKRVSDETLKDDLLTWAAALAYSWLFAIFPFFIFLLTLLPYLPDYAKAAGGERDPRTTDADDPRVGGHDLAQYQ